MADVADSTGWLNPENDQILRWKARPANRSGRCKALPNIWLAGARLTEIAHLVMLAKGELTRRGITLTWSISQTDRLGRAGRPRGET